MESILVTGGAGFIGSNIAEALLAQGYGVVVLDDLSSGKMENIEHLQNNENFTFVKGTILDSGLLRSILRTYSIRGISHQAAIPSVTKSILEPVETIEANIAGTANVFNIAASRGCKRIVFASSCAVYGDGPEPVKREDMAMRPLSPYAVSKAAKEMLAQNFCQLHQMEIVGLRYFNVYGRRQDPGSGYAAVIPTFITKAIKNEPIPIEGDGGQTRDFVFVDDVVKANLLALKAGNCAGRCFNVASGASISIIELARIVIDVAGSRSAIMHTSARPGDIRDSQADIGNAGKDLGFSPEYDIATGLEQAIAWYRKVYRIQGQLVS
ncbi:MAG TPA: NAD-dependent epimerase/dehydratase family protein [Nitrospirota bacterium]|nr:NAD-dependent epimerase/dehydratase family protein [Nitrospirota bacterium]